jgi:3-oxoadipate enol-lactonase
MAGLLGGIRPRLTRSVLKAFPLPETIAMAEAIPDAGIAVLEGVAHLAALENPAVVNKLIKEFVFRE